MGVLPEAGGWNDQTEETRHRFREVWRCKRLTAAIDDQERERKRKLDEAAKGKAGKR